MSFFLLFYYLKIKIQIDCDALIHRQRGQIIRLVTAVNMTVRRRHHPHSISVPQLRSPFHRTSNPTILVRVVDVVVFDRQDHSTNLTKKKSERHFEFTDTYNRFSKTEHFL